MGKHDGKGKLNDRDLDVSITLKRILKKRKDRRCVGWIRLVQDRESDGLL